jgi:rhamnulokinase
MPNSTNYLALDLGASSGRAVIGRFNGSTVNLEEVHRFPNGAIELPGGLYWDAVGLFGEILTGLRKAAATADGLKSTGLDTWGVDFALLDRAGELIGIPHCYRDPRVDGVMEEAFKTVSRDQIFDRTGIQFMAFNTLFQLYASVRESSPHLDIAETFLTMPDLFNYWLTGTKVCEFSNATTTQCFDPRKRAWSTNLLDTLGIPSRIFPDIVQPGTSLGPIRDSIAREAGIPGLNVVAPACHDTGSAVAAVPMASEDALYISLGTWALMGAEIREPAINEKSLTYNFTNEGGVDGTYRFLKNIAGLWLVQESKRTWDLTGNALTFNELTGRAQQAPALTCLIDPDHPDFVAPGDMPERIRSFCKRTTQTPPESEGEVIRCALDSLALKCRFVLGNIMEALERSFSTIHIVGGGIQNTLLCQLIADATGLQVQAGPVEATALGNILVQAIANGDIANLSEARDVVRASTPVQTYDPGPSAAWDDAYARFLNILT